MGSAIFEYNKGQSSKYEKILHSIYILFLQEQKFGLFHHLEKNEAQTKKNDRNLPISAILDQPYLNTTKVNPKLENRKLRSSIIILRQ